MAMADLHGLKLFWGVIFAFVFLCFILSFVKGVVRNRGVTYNWLRVALSFLTIGLALYLVFFVQF